VHLPMQKIMGDRLRPAASRDPYGVAEAKARLHSCYAMIDKEVSSRIWAMGDAFSLADCAAAPALFYADTVCPFSLTHPRLAAYFDRPAARPSFARVIVEARPYFPSYPFRDRIPARFLDDRR
jgi:glutathione S-transferase